MYQQLNQQFLEQMVNPFKYNLSGPLSQWGQIATRASENFTKQNMALANELLNMSAKYTQSIPNIKKPEEMVELHTSFMSVCANKYFNFMNQAVENALNLASDSSKLWLESAKSATEESMQVKANK
jgi:hypothetical protein